MSTRKVKVTLNPVANTYAGTSERIIEYSSPNGGGLISFRLSDDGHLIIDMYREDESVLILVGDRHKTHSPSMRVPGTISSRRENES